MLTKRLAAVYHPHFPPDLPALPSGRLRPRLPPDLPVRLFQKPCPTGRALILSADCFLLAIIFLLLLPQKSYIKSNDNSGIAQTAIPAL